MVRRSTAAQGSDDINEVGARVVAHATEEELQSTDEHDKNPAAVALGRLGGRKGGPARAKKLSARRRQDIARKAAKARWKKRPKKSSN